MTGRQDKTERQRAGGRAEPGSHMGLTRGYWGLPALGRGLRPLALCALLGCTPIYSMHGYVPDAETLAQIEIGLDTRDTVEAFLGRATTDGLLGDRVWYYVQSKWKTVGLAAPQEYDRQVLAITFDEAGRVANLEIFGLERGKVVTLSRRVTTTPVKSRSALAQIFSNIGRVNAADLFADR